MDSITCGDCIDVLAGLEDESIDLIVTSPPYGIGKEYETKKTIEEYREFAEKWTKHIPRLLKPHGSFWLNVGYMKLEGNRTLPLTYLYHDIVELPLIQEIVWHYEGGLSYKRRFTHRTERWMWFAKDPGNVRFNLDEVREPTKVFDKRNNPLGKNPTDYWFFDRVTNNSREKTSHPCQFPELMIERIVKACSDPDDQVVDPFGGSLTTSAVCSRLGRKCSSIELDSKYIDEGRFRLRTIPDVFSS